MSLPLTISLPSQTGAKYMSRITIHIDQAEGDHSVVVDSEWTPPVATHYTVREGGAWYAWHNWSTSTTQSATDKIFAVKFSNGWIWDCMVGWRKS